VGVSRPTVIPRIPAGVAKMRATVAVLLLPVGFARPAAGQEVIVGAAAYRQYVTDDLSEFGRPLMAEVRFSFPLSDRFAFEPFIDVPSHMVGAQIRQRLVRFSTQKGSYAFVSYGVATFISGHVGFGWHQRLSDRLAFRPEVRLVTFHVVPIGVLLAGGVSVRLGR
jgi:hypothetical protein